MHLIQPLGDNVRRLSADTEAVILKAFPHGKLRVTSSRHRAHGLDLRS